ncbi:TIGR00730 family Rossman fold protein [Lichenihabitans sp. PAMC28606]|uniref:LOG family protein n=1 Tax=Lichenihabitans sp. PAMC28606 TaxID=2880932 RepID=UPI001D0AD4EF|nr:TIGR00730 family Rossman fold protein [Lichenihabitans sp. PAMC28606]UDL95270.1 TIGR00730 family Rossman fold protein [Lichenihabitans sp. PAMC28606]
MSDLKSICVYCGSASGTNPHHLKTAEDLGRAMAEAGIGLVYGGGNAGLMGATARSVLAHGGHVTGIIPDFLRDRELVLSDAQEMIVVPDMHTRKQMMFERSDAFVALPGGIGTLEELVEQMTWVQLERHTKPVLIADIDGFWQPLVALLEHMRENGFVRPSAEVNYIVAERTADIIPMLREAQARTAQLGLSHTVLDTPL